MTSRFRQSAVPRGTGTLRAAAETLLMVAGATAAGLAGASVVPETAADLLYLVPVLAASSLYGLRGGALAAIAGALAYDFFFTAPLYRLWVSDPGELVTIIMLLGVALVTGRLTAKLRARTRAAAERAAQDAALAAFSQALVGLADEAALGRAICAEVGRLLDAEAVLVLGRADAPRLVAVAPPRDRAKAFVLEEFDREAAARAIAGGRPAGRGTPGRQGTDWTFYPLIVGPDGGAIGAIGLARDDGLAPARDGGQALLDMVLAQAALAIERLRLAAEVHEMERLRERDRLRGALISSVGHDLRTPLTAVLAAAAALRREGAADPELVATLEAEARRLDRYIANLLDMARLEAGAIRLRVEPVDLTDAVDAALRDVRRGLEGCELRVAVPADLPLVRLDPQLFHHCLINLIDNAARHGGGTPVAIVGERTADGAALRVLDEGPGLPPDTAARLFGTFARLDGSDRTGGAGLGLAIVKGFADAMNFGVEAGNRPGTTDGMVGGAGGGAVNGPGGAVFSLRFPAALLVADAAAEAAE